MCLVDTGLMNLTTTVHSEIKKKKRVCLCMYVGVYICVHMCIYICVYVLLLF